MEAQIEVKVFSKVNPSSRYHLATFNAPIKKNTSLKSHIIEEQFQVRVAFLN